jgi:hypothetical protein
MDVLEIILGEGEIDLVEIGEPFANLLKLVTVLFLELFADFSNKCLEFDHFLGTFWLLFYFLYR